METILSGVEFIGGGLQALENTLFIGALGLTALKGAMAIYKAILGNFKQSFEESKWVFIGLCVLALTHGLLITYL